MAIPTMQIITPMIVRSPATVVKSFPPATIGGINVPKALGDFLVLEAVYKTNGCAVTVGDDEILRAQASLASEEGAYVCPEGAATLSAAIRLLKEGWVKADESVVLLNTGTGLKYPEAVNITLRSLHPDDELPVY
ncbi:MAG: threonine synthase [Deltaproteobacteria bacterium]|nr:threonine synthase [Deltaproteobacteria bacterium]